MPVQLRFHTGLTGADYVIRQGWKLASLPHCPEHGPNGGCHFHYHGTYDRKTPPGTKVARWYCPEAHRTWSLLPDHLAARFPGTLREIEEVVACIEQATESLEKQAQQLCSLDVSLPCALRWVRRRLAPVRKLLTTVIGLLPQLLLGCEPGIAALRKRLGCECVLVRLREVAEVHLAALAPPLGFKHPAARGADREEHYQQQMGPDPPLKPA